MIPVETSEIDIDQLAEAVRGGATIIDVRELGEYVVGHVPGAVLIPMGQLPGRMAELYRDAPVYVVRVRQPQRHDDRVPAQRRLRRLLGGQRDERVGPVGPSRGRR